MEIQVENELAEESKQGNKEKMFIFDDFGVFGYFGLVFKSKKKS